MPRTGHILNGRATRFAHTEPVEGVIRRAPKDFASLEEALAEMHAAGVSRLVIDGGDGTIREVLSRAPEIWEGEPPEYAIIPSGNTNLIARSAGVVEGEDAVARVDAAPITAFRRVTLPVLRVERAGRPPLRGFIMGAGAYEAATRVAHEEIAARHGAQVLIAIWKLLTGPRLREGARIGVNGDRPRPRMLTACTTLPGSLIYGFEPFWGEGEGPIRWLDIDKNPPLLALSAPFVAFGRPTFWMRRAYRSGAASRLELALETDFVLDGECFDPGDDGRVRVFADETATFLSL